MKTNNEILSGYQLADLNTIFNSNIQFTIKNGGRYLPIGGKWVTADGVASRIKAIANTTQDKASLQQLVGNFTTADNLGYEALRIKIKNSKPFEALIMKICRFFKTLFSKTKEMRHEMLAGLPQRIVARQQAMIQMMHEDTMRRLELPLDRMKRFYAKVLETTDFSCKELEGYSPSKSILTYLNDLKLFRQQGSSPKLDRVIAELEFAYKIALIEGINVPEIKETVLQEIQQKIQNLPSSDGSCVLIPGGSETHAIMYKVEKNPDETFSFTIINTGAGADHNILSSVWTYFVNGRLTVQDVVYSKLTMEHLSKEFISKILEQRTFPDMGSVNQWVETALNNGNWNYGRKHKGQRKGTCAFKSVSSTLHEKLGDKVYNSFKAFLTEKEIRDFERLHLPPDQQPLKVRMLAEGERVLRHRNSK